MVFHSSPGGSGRRRAPSDWGAGGGLDRGSPAPLAPLRGQDRGPRDRRRQLSQRPRQAGRQLGLLHWCAGL
eukprot:80875-Prorocentrum_minimum.AAC.1